MLTNSDLLFLFGAIGIFLFLPTIFSKLIQVIFNRNIEYANSVSENFKDDRINEEMVGAKALLEGLNKGGG